MSNHQRFNFQSKEELEKTILDLGLNLRLKEDISVLSSSLVIKNHTLANRIAILPMEGCDSNPDGSPSELVSRRYERFFLGGAGLVWWEANAVCQEGRANENSMFINLPNMQTFAFLLKDLKRKAYEANGYTPLSILQLTHSGRYSRPVGHKAAPIIAFHDPVLDPRVGLRGDESVASDDYLESLVPKYVNSAILAKEAGFDGVDIKCCHRYLLSELLASHLREGRYGGSFENRISLIIKIIQEVRKAVGEDFIIASRFNVFDAHPYPYGFGEDKDDMWKFDPTEPMKFVRRVIANGVNLLSNSAGNPYYIYPQVTRPFDQSSMGIPTPEEHPLESIQRLFEFTSEIQKAAGDVPVIGNGYSWLREFAPLFASANIDEGRCAMMGFGRQAIAYPDAPNDILKNGSMQRSKCCVACSKCTQIMRDHGKTGCVMRDSKVYLPKYRQYRQEAEERECKKQ